jgi:hypothetical protein
MWKGAVMMLLGAVVVSAVGAATAAAQKPLGPPQHHHHPVAAAAVWRPHKKDELVARKVKTTRITTRIAFKLLFYFFLKLWSSQ